MVGYWEFYFRLVSISCPPRCGNPQARFAPKCFKTRAHSGLAPLWIRFVLSQWCRRLLRMYATAAARSDGLLLLCGGRDAEGVPLGDAYGLARHRDGRWEWAAAPGKMPDT